MGKNNPKNSAAFVSHLGPHKRSSLSNELKMPQFIDGMNSDMKHEAKFKQAHKTLGKMGKLTDAMRFGNRIAAGLSVNGENSILNLGTALISYLTQSNVQQIGKNDTIYYKTHTHIGKPTTSKLKKLQEGPFVEKLTKTFTDSSEDYQSHEKRKQLNIKTGFNQKSFCFLLEDSFFTVKDFYDIFKIGKRFTKDFRSSDGLRDIFGCVTKSHFQLKVKNKLANYSSHIQIHLVKVTDVETDIRTLIENITHNSTIGTKEESGRIPKEFQYSNPLTTDFKNTISCDFQTDLRCRLQQSTKFKEKAKIIKSWQSTLPPCSTWDFNLTTHYGRGIHLNSIYDLFHDSKQNALANSKNYTIEIDPKELTKNFLEKSIKDNIENLRTNKKIRISKENIKKIFKNTGIEFNKELNNALHPVNYTLILEIVGDRRGSIQRDVDEDCFGGYSPCNLNFEFLKNMTYLAMQEDESNLLVYKKIQQDRNFEEDSEFSKIFCPDRSTKLNVNFDDITFPGQKPKKSNHYTMDYDKILMSEPDYPNILGTLKNLFEKVGIENEQGTEDDASLNFTSTTPDRPESPREDSENNQEEYNDNERE
jgi:hypothetical protein